MRRLLKKINKKKLVVPVIFLIVLSLSVVCASLSSTLLINGDAHLRVSADIRVTNVQMINPTNGAYESVNTKFDKDSTDLFPALPNLNSEITFRITVQNNSNDIYVISSIDEVLTNENIVSNKDTYEGTIINPNSSVNLDITYSYDTETLPETTEQTAKLKYHFEKPNASMIEYASEYTSETNVQDALDELYDLFDE